MKAMQIAGIALILVGLLFALNVVSLATIIVDNTPPQFVSMTPKGGETFTTAPTTATAHVTDPESGVASVKLTIDSTAYTLSLTSGTIFDGTWSASITAPSTGSHTASWSASNKAGLSVSNSGTFTVSPTQPPPTQLQGDWYINSELISTSTQTVYSATTTVRFTFMKTAGPDDSSVTCKVLEGTSTLVTLSNTGAGKWEGSYTFSLGTHSVTLQASSSSGGVVMSIVDIDFTSKPIFGLSIQQLIGILMVGAGLVVVMKKP
jgi:hypothetical protein